MYNINKKEMEGELLRCWEMEEEELKMNKRFVKFEEWEEKTNKPETEEWEEKTESEREPPPESGCQRERISGEAGEVGDKREKALR